MISMGIKYFGRHLFERHSWPARVLSALLLCWVSAAAAEVAVPPLTGRVVDQTGTLRPSDRAALTQELKDLEARKGSQIAVLIVPTTQPETIEQYSLRVAEAWKIGRRKIDDGALLVIAKDDRKVRIEVGYGLEGSLTDVTARRIIDEVIVPRFRTGDFAGGIDAGIARIIGVVDGEPLPRPAPETRHGGGDLDWLGFSPLFWILVGCVFCSFIWLIVRVLVGPFSTLLGSAVTGGIAGAIAWMLGGSLVAVLDVTAIVFVVFIVLVTLLGRSLGSGPAIRPRYSGGWSGDSHSGSSGGWSDSSSPSGISDSGGSSSSSSDSGFSGGGGDFGGGGASGSW